MEKKVLIVGSGIAGLSAGLYARMNGFNTSIFEMHSLPGGLCTGWERKGYKWDLSMHFLTGAVSGPYFQMWKELGVMESTSFHFHRETAQIEGMGKRLLVSADRSKMEQAMLAISPADADLIREFTALIFGPDMMGAVDLKPKELRKFRDKIRMFRAILPLLKLFRKYDGVSIQDFVKKFKDPFLRLAIRSYVDAPGWPMRDFPMAILAGFMKVGVKEGGVPLGGSQRVVFQMADRFKRMGGEIHYKSKVKDLVLLNGRVKGITLEDGSTHQADEVIWAGDGFTLIYQILNGAYVDKQITHMYENWTPKEPVLQVMMGVNRDMSGQAPMTLLELDQAITITGQEHKWIQVRHRCFDPSMAPKGKSAVEVWYDTDFEFWEELSRDKKAYEAEKKRIADETIARLDIRWPGFASQVEVIDVPTPHSYYRYTGNYRGSPDGWCINTDNMQVRDPILSLPGLKGLHMAGQWTAPYTGVVIAAQTGRQVIQLLCKKEKRKFVTQIPEQFF